MNVGRRLVMSRSGVGGWRNRASRLLLMKKLAGIKVRMLEGHLPMFDGEGPRAPWEVQR